MPWRVQERVRGPAGGLPTLSEPWLSRPAAGAATARRACAERSTVWWNCARVSWEFCGSSRRAADGVVVADRCAELRRGQLAAQEPCVLGVRAA